MSYFSPFDGRVNRGGWLALYKIMSKFEKAEVKITAGQDDEHLPIQCICGHGKKPWDFFISIYEDHPDKCPECGREYYFKGKGNSGVSNATGHPAQYCLRRLGNPSFR